MAEFKNLNTNTGFFRAGKNQYQFNGIFKTEDKEVIEVLTKAKNSWKRVDAKIDVSEEIEKENVKKVEDSAIDIQEKSKNSLFKTKVKR